MDLLLYRMNHKGVLLLILFIIKLKQSFAYDGENKYLCYFRA